MPQQVPRVLSARSNRSSYSAFDENNNDPPTEEELLRDLVSQTRFTGSRGNWPTPPAQTGAVTTIVNGSQRIVTASTGDAAALVTTEATARADADSALASDITTLTSTVGTNTAAISTEASTRASADTAISATVTALTSTVGTNTAAISTEASTRASADTAISATVTALTSTVGTNTAAISTEASTRASADTALSTSVSTLTATVENIADHYTANLSSGMTDLGGGSYKNTSGVDAWNQQVYSSESYIGGAYVSWVAVDASHHLMVGLDSNPTEDAQYSNIDYCLYLDSTGYVYFYESGSYSAIATYVAGDRFEITYDGAFVRYYRNGLILREVAASAGLNLYLDSSFHTSNSQISNLRFGPLNAAGLNAKALVSSEASTRASADTAISATVTALTSTVGTNTAAISTEASTRASADTAISATVTALTSTVGTNTAAISTEASTRASADGAIHAMWGVYVDVNGRIAGRINLDATNQSSSFIVAVDKFVVENANGTVTAMDIRTGGKIVFGADIQSDNFSAGSAGWRCERTSGNAEFNNVTVRGTLNASDITAGTIAGAYLPSAVVNAILGKYSDGGTRASTSYGPLTSYGTNPIEVTVTCDGNIREVRYSAAYLANATGATDTLHLALYMDGSTLIAEFGGSSGVSLTSSQQIPVEFSGFVTPSAGSHTFQLYVKSDAGGSTATGGTISVS